MPSRFDHEDETTAGRWPTWWGGLGFVVAIGGAVFIGSLVVVVSGGGDADGGPVRIVATLIQDVMLLAIAIGLASRLGRPSAADFGWRPSRLRHAARWLLIGGVGFYAFAALYGLAVRQEGEQDVLEVLGAEDNTASLLMTALIIIVVAPVCEETFFRGFFYRALRNGMSALPATLVVAGIFGAIHYSGPDTLVLLPVLAVLGAVFCQLYERTGSLYPAMALHAFNNAVAFGATATNPAAPAIAVSLGVIVVAGCGAGLTRAPARS